jgi:hypothetical protein
MGTIDVRSEIRGFETPTALAASTDYPDRSDGMTPWTPDDLTRIGQATEVQITSTRPDGTLRPYVTIWGVRVGDDLYIRSAYGPANGWFRRARASGTGRIRAAGIERDVTFTAPDPDPDVNEAVDAAYHAKYDRYGPAIVGTVVGPAAHDVTLRLERT